MGSGGGRKDDGRERGDVEKRGKGFKGNLHDILHGMKDHLEKVFKKENTEKKELLFVQNFPL